MISIVMLTAVGSRASLLGLLARVMLSKKIALLHVSARSYLRCQEYATHLCVAVVPPPPTADSCAKAAKDGNFLLSLTLPPAEVYCVAATPKAAAKTYLKLPVRSAVSSHCDIRLTMQLG